MDNLLQRITMDPNILYGKPSIRGLSYSVEMILELLNGGSSIDEILEDYEDLERDDILAVFAYYIKQMSETDKLILLEELWTSVCNDLGDDKFIPDWHLDMLHKIKQKEQNNELIFSDLEDIKQRLKS